MLYNNKYDWMTYMRQETCRIADVKLTIVWDRKINIYKMKNMANVAVHLPDYQIKYIVCFFKATIEFFNHEEKSQGRKKNIWFK